MKKCKIKKQQYLDRIEGAMLQIESLKEFFITHQKSKSDIIGINQLIGVLDVDEKRLMKLKIKALENE